MHIGQALDPELISRCLTEDGTVTLRKRHLPLEILSPPVPLSMPENDAAFPRQTLGGKPGLCPQVKMVCQMELTSHLLTGAAFSTMKESENALAEPLISQTGDNTLTLMDKGYYSLSLLNTWNLAGDKTDNAAEQADVAKQEARTRGAGALGSITGL